MDGLEDEPPYHCGHDPARFVTGDEGTAYCPACEAEAAKKAIEVHHCPPQSGN